MTSLLSTLAGVSIDGIRRHIQALQGVRHPQVDPAALERAADYIAHHLAEVGCSSSQQFFRDGEGEFRNIIATRRGQQEPERRVLVVAHYDTVAGSPGADDNASGVAVLLELARLLQPLNFARSLQFVGVSLEENREEDQQETGLRGSRALATLARAEGWDIEGVVVLESVAYAGDAVPQTAPPGVPVAVPEFGNFLAAVANEASQSLLAGLARTVEEQALALPLVPLVLPGNGEVLPDSRRSDHASFWDQGFRALMLTDTTNFRNPHYHQPTDTLETLNLAFAAQVCRAAAGLVTQLAWPL